MVSTVEIVACPLILILIEVRAERQRIEFIIKFGHVVQPRDFTTGSGVQLGTSLEFTADGFVVLGKLAGTSEGNGKALDREGNILGTSEESLLQTVTTVGVSKTGNSAVDPNCLLNHNKTLRKKYIPACTTISLNCVRLVIKRCVFVREFVKCHVDILAVSGFNIGCNDYRSQDKTENDD